MIQRLLLVWESAAAILLSCAAIATVAFTVGVVYRLHVPLPFWDEWYMIPGFRAYAEGTYAWTDLVAQHNEHRLLFPRLFFFADELLFHMSGTLNLTVTFLLQFSNATILILLMRPLVARVAHQWLLASVILLSLFTLRQEQNFSNGFQLQFVGVFTAAMLAAVAFEEGLNRVDEGRRRCWLPFGLAAFWCFVSTYTMANGVLAGFVLAIAALLRRAPLRVPLVTAALSVVLAVVFFHNYAPGQSSLPIMETLMHPLRYVRYLTAYLGNPVGSDIRATQTLGTFGLMATAAAAWLVVTRRERHRASFVLLIIAGFIVATAAATTYGRIGNGTEQALESRYATPSEIFWVALVVFWFPVAARWFVAKAIVFAVMATLCVAALIFEVDAWPLMAAQAAALRQVSDSLLSGLYDGEVANAADLVTDDDIAPLIPFLREHRLSAFAAPEARYLGRRLADLGPISLPGLCRGEAHAQSVPVLGQDGVRLSAWARDEADQQTLHQIVVVDASRTVIGLGSAALPGQKPDRWAGYAKARPGEDLHAYARLANDAFCDLGGVMVQPSTPH